MIDIKNEYVNFDFDEETIKCAVSLTLLDHISDDYELSILLTDDKRIKELNREYRCIDSPTDVLAFPMIDSFENLKISPIVLGDVVISLDTAKRQAENAKHSLDAEMVFLTVHGLLHLLGYDHQTKTDAAKMFNKQNAILKKMKVTIDIQAIIQETSLNND